MFLSGLKRLVVAEVSLRDWNVLDGVVPRAASTSQTVEDRGEHLSEATQQVYIDLTCSNRT